MLVDRRKGIAPVRALRDDIEIFRRIQTQLDAPSREGLVVHYEGADLHMRAAASEGF